MKKKMLFRFKLAFDDYNKLSFKEDYLCTWQQRVYIDFVRWNFISELYNVGKT